MKATVRGIQVEGTPDEIGVFLRSFLAKEKLEKKQSESPGSDPKPSLKCDICGATGFKTEAGLNVHKGRKHKLKK